MPKHPVAPSHPLATATASTALRRRRRLGVIAASVACLHLVALERAPLWLAAAHARTPVGSAPDVLPGAVTVLPTERVDAAMGPPAADRTEAPARRPDRSTAVPRSAPPALARSAELEPDRPGSPDQVPASLHAQHDADTLPTAAADPERGDDAPASPAPLAELAAAAIAPAAGSSGRPPRSGEIDGAMQAPGSATLVYRMERGLLFGTGMLEWRNDAQRYRLRLEGQLPILGTIFVQQSEGGFDAFGLAPTRFTERRLRRSERAVNFVREPGSAPRIAFSAATGSAPLRPGAQDRVSWIGQLATRLSGVRSLPPGTRLEMDVAGPKGDVQHWIFVLLSIEADRTWHWRRDMLEPIDTGADVWTDPAQGHWPRRVRLTEEHGDPLDLHLLEVRRGTP